MKLCPIIWWITSTTKKNKKIIIIINKNALLQINFHLSIIIIAAD